MGWLPAPSRQAKPQTHFIEASPWHFLGGILRHFGPQSLFLNTLHPGNQELQGFSTVKKSAERVLTDLRWPPIFRFGRISVMIAHMLQDPVNNGHIYYPKANLGKGNFLFRSSANWPTKLI
jgi:hypothetical protein